MGTLSMFRMGFVFISVLCLVTPKHISAQSKTANFVELINDSDSDYVGRAVNNLGQVVGRAGGALGTGTRAFVWKGNKALERVVGSNNLVGSNNNEEINPGNYSAAFSINDLEEVVGAANVGNSIRAFLSTPAAGPKLLANLPGDNGGHAFAINKSGEIVGFSTGPNGQRACLWSRNGAVENLGVLLGGNSSKASDISDSGDVVGTSASSSGIHAFLWTRKDGLQDLGVLPGDKTSEAYAVNNSGEVVGYSQGPRGVRAFRWTRKTGMLDLGFLPGGKQSRALDINNVGDVIGTSGSPSGVRAFIWTSKDGMKDLNSLIPQSLGLVLVEADAINDKGQVTVLATENRPDGHDHEGPNRLFLLDAK